MHISVVTKNGCNSDADTDQAVETGIFNNHNNTANYESKNIIIIIISSGSSSSNSSMK